MAYIGFLTISSKDNIIKHHAVVAGVEFQIQVFQMGALRAFFIQTLSRKRFTLDFPYSVIHQLLRKSFSMSCGWLSRHIRHAKSA
jgi:hypothetical protein